MKFSELRIKNFRSIGEATVKLDGQGLTLVEGRNLLKTQALETNGTGKSSMFSALFYVIYGTLPNGDGADKVINNTVGKGTLVELDLSTDKGNFTISRGRKKNVLTLVSGEDDLTKGTSKETQALIDNIVGIPKDIFLSTLYFDGHNSQPFSSLTDKQRKAYLETLFDIGIYQKGAEQTKADIQDQQKELTAVREQQTAYKYRIAPLEDNLNQLKSQQEHYEATLQSLEQDVLSKADILLSTRDTAKDNEVHLKAREESLRASMSLLEGDDGSQVREAQANLKRTSDELQRGRIRQESIKGELANKKAMMVSLSESELCLVCGNPIDANHKEKELASIKESILPLVEEYKALDTTLSTLATQQQEQEQAYTELNTAFQEIEKNKYALQSEMRDLQQQAYTQVTQPVQIAEQAVTQATQARDTFVSQNQGLEENVIRIQQSLVEAKDNLAKETVKVEDLASKISRMEEVLRAFSDKGIKSHVLDLMTPEMNNTIQSYLSQLTGGTISVLFSTQDTKANGDVTDKFSIQVTNNGKETDYSGLSSGEQRRLDLAISLTLQDILMRKSDAQSNVLIYDELFESLDGVGSERVVELLRERLGNTVTSIFVVTHNETLKPLFGNTITVIKESDGVSRIEGGNLKWIY